MKRALGVALALLIAASCSAPSTPALRVVRLSGLYPVAAFDRSVDDAASVQRLYSALVSLPFATDRWCPYSVGTRYQLTFSDTSRSILVANVESDGCREAIIPGSGRRATNDSFWAVFADTLGLDARNTDELFPQPLAWYELQQRLPKPRHPSLKGITCSCSSGSFRATTAMTGSS
jgi:hypothetical protein